MSQKEFFWLHRDYHNRSLNEMAKSITEYNTAFLLNKGYEVFYCTNGADPQLEQAEIGSLFPTTDLDYTVKDTHIVNDIFNFNVYFTKNTEDRIQVPAKHYKTFDCLVSLAAGDKIDKNPIDIGLLGNNHYVIDISPTAIHKSMGIYKAITSYNQLDIFNTTELKQFLATCKGTKGFFVVSNCFLYSVSALIYDVKLRLQMQNQFIEILANDKIDWYVEMDSADGEFFNCVRAKDIQNKKLDKRFKALPWI
jgi:hypothetical protein